MKLLLVVTVISFCSFAINGEEKYDKKYDNINIDEILDNKRLLVAYIKCILEKGKCTAEGYELKSHITDALQTGCKKCTKQQRDGIRKVISHMINHEPEYWGQMVDKYDAERIYTHRYEKELKTIH
uniref:Chemosensory protein n=1 Tax=Dendrolimus houi TaxID=765132 RepID=A0A076E5S5_9NEOP|nr:chemosensory protein [Dendrolimus houi]